MCFNIKQVSKQMPHLKKKPFHYVLVETTKAGMTTLKMATMTCLYLYFFYSFLKDY